jgi:pimeloyl-ACP methyl ester carboxylesterase
VTTTTVEAPDGTRLAHDRVGRGEPLVCLPGGPMLPGRYLGDLGGLTAHRTLVRPDLRGTGNSGVPADPSTYRCDRQVDDVEALRRHLALDRIDLFGHSAGGTLALQYAVRHPDRVARLLMVAPSPFAVGLAVTDADRREVAESRRGEPWFPEAFAAFERIWAGEATGADREAITPFMHGRWDAAARERSAAEDRLRVPEAAAGYYADGAIDADAVRSALASLEAPVLVVAGEHDVALPPRRAADYADLFPHGELVVLPGAGHAPWHDDPEAFTSAVAGFLR